MSPQPIDSLKGFAVTFKQLFKKPITQQYPEYKRPVYPRFRGRHRLHRHANGLEKCIGCSLCAAACPADCIRVVADELAEMSRDAMVYTKEMLLEPMHPSRTTPVAPVDPFDIVEPGP